MRLILSLRAFHAPRRYQACFFHWVTSILQLPNQCTYLSNLELEEKLCRTRATHFSTQNPHLARASGWHWKMQPSLGCLWAIPESHKDGLVRRLIRDENGVHFDRSSPYYDNKDFVPVEVKAGSLVVIHGDLIHQSFENQSPKSRHALSLHIVETDSRIWFQDNWFI